MAESSTGFAAAAAGIRDSAKWLLAVAAAIGAILVGGVQISGVAKLPSPTLEQALASAFVGLIGVAWAVTGVGELLLPRSFTMKEIGLATTGRERKLRTDLERRPELLGGWGTPANLAGALDAATAGYQEALTSWRDAQPGDPKKDARAVLDERTAVLNHVSAVTRDAGDWANYLSLRNDYSSVLTRRLLPGLFVALIGLVGVMLLSAERDGAKGPDISKASLPSGSTLEHGRFVGADLADATLAGVSFAFSDLSGASFARSDLSHADFTGANLAGANLVGAVLTDATWAQTTCPDGTNSDAVGRSCEAHLAVGPAPSG